MSKKLILAMLACLLVLVCAACGSSSDAPSGTEASDIMISEEKRCYLSLTEISEGGYN